MFTESDLFLDVSDKKYVLRVRDLEEENKPREKMMQSGPDVLSLPELLAVVLNVGTKKEEVMQMTSRILKEYGDKNIANQTNPQILAKDLDIPIGKACQIVATFALGKRFFKSNNVGSVTLRSAKDAFEYLKDMRDLPKEHLRGLYLNSRYQLVHDEVISIGSLTSNVVHPREVFKPALDYSAVAVILAHNHPSGSPKPSTADIEVTAQLVKAGKILGVEVLDHIIIAKNKFSSVPSDYNV